jgi:tRNA modification GTPase
MPNPADTVFAQSTAPGRSAIAIVRLSGPAVPDVLSALCGRIPAPRVATLARLRDPTDGNLIDEALVLYFPAPRSETGEAMAEFQLHGSRAVVRALFETLGRYPGLRPAEPGEFVRRALANGKLDLAQIEGLADLVEAETDAQRRQAIDALTGSHSARYAELRGSILQALALVEAAIDFADEADVSDRAIADANGRAEALADRLSRELARKDGEIVRDGFRIVITGAPNAGKSSLLNALARRDAAIVSDEAGTTRDVVTVSLDLDGVPVVVSDTAGLRETNSKVEQEGIRRTQAEASRADLVLWLAEPGGPATPPPDLSAGDAPVILVETKADLLTGLIHVKQPAKNGPTGHRISTIAGTGIDGLVADLAARARAATTSAAPSEALITRARHRRELTAAHRQLLDFLANASRPAELRAEDLRGAANAIGRLTGHIGAEDVLGEIFGRFCIGK